MAPVADVRERTVAAAASAEVGSDCALKVSMGDTMRGKNATAMLPHASTADTRTTTRPEPVAGVGK